MKMGTAVSRTEIRATPASEQAAESKLRRAAWIVAMVLALLQMWAERQGMNPDGISYLDLSDAWMRLDWHAAVNVYWSPLYAMLIAAARAVLHPSAYWEFTVVHVVNFFMFLVSLLCFEFFWKEFLRSPGREQAIAEGKTFSRWAWWLLGYSLFLWSALAVISVGRVSPDQLVGADFFLCSGLLLRIRRQRGGWLEFVALGLALAVGYYAKAPMFLLAFIFFAVALFALGNWRRAIPRVGLAAIIFLLVCSPLITTLSRQRGRLTFGESGRWAYLAIASRYGHMIPKGRAIHPLAKVFEQPTVYSLVSPIGGTYPRWLDPTYWSEGVVVRFSVTAEMDLLKNNFASYMNMLVSTQTGLLFGLLLLLLLSERGGRGKAIAAEWPLLVPALAGFGMYLPVYVEPRMVGSFFVVLWAALFGSVRLSRSETVERVARAVVLVIAVLLGVLFIAPGLGDMYRIFRPKPNRQWAVADGLRRLGMKPGEKIGVIGDCATIYWPRLARLKIRGVIDVPDVEAYWAAPAATKSRVMDAFATTGAQIVVTNTVPAGQPALDWQPVGDTGYFIHPLNKGP
jgi:4-amino-4-deoxy-L-arabinose transferase-like glycosyltransferase